LYQLGSQARLLADLSFPSECEHQVSGRHMSHSDGCEYVV
jgi:hypothetical protein